MNGSDVWMETEYLDLSLSKGRIYPFFKRMMDILMVSIAVILLLPIFLLISVLVKITSKGKNLIVKICTKRWIFPMILNFMQIKTSQ